MQHAPFAINSERIVTPKGVVNGSLLIEDGKISRIGNFDQTAELPIIDAQNLVVMPGVIDPHVHINEPGREDWEGFRTATQAALAGGTTTVVDMPLNSSPVTVSEDSFRRKTNAAQNKLFSNVGFWGGLVPQSITQLPGLLDCGVLGVKAFMCHSGIEEFPEVNVKQIRAALPLLKEKKLPLLVHAELITAIANPKPTSRNYQDYLASRPSSWELSAIKKIIQLVEEYNTPIHIVHLATADALPILKAARKRWPISVETCPHYLFFSSEDIPDGHTEFKCAPPIRDRHNNQLLWKAAESGDIDFIATDHSPAPAHLKLMEEGDFINAWGGISSIQFLLSLIWSVGKPQGLSLNKLVDLTSARASRFIGLDHCKGKIALGYDADLVIWDPERSFTVKMEDLKFKHKITPYLGQKLWGTIEKTILNGHVVYDKGVVSETPRGNFIYK